MNRTDYDADPPPQLLYNHETSVGGISGLSSVVDERTVVDEHLIAVMTGESIGQDECIK